MLRILQATSASAAASRAQQPPGSPDGGGGTSDPGAATSSASLNGSAAASVDGSGSNGAFTGAVTSIGSAAIARGRAAPAGGPRAASVPTVDEGAASLAASADLLGGASSASSLDATVLLEGTELVPRVRPCPVFHFVSCNFLNSE